jgi:hypothetical protein
VAKQIYRTPVTYAISETFNTFIYVRMHEIIETYSVPWGNSGNTIFLHDLVSGPIDPLISEIICSLVKPAFDYFEQYLKDNMRFVFNTDGDGDLRFMSEFTSLHLYLTTNICTIASVQRYIDEVLKNESRAPLPPFIFSLVGYQEAKRIVEGSKYRVNYSFPNYPRITDQLAQKYEADMDTALSLLFGRKGNQEIKLGDMSPEIKRMIYNQLDRFRPPTWS